MADGLMNRDLRIFNQIVRAIQKSGADRDAATKLAVDSIVALHTAGVEGRFVAHAVVDGRAVTLAPAAWLKGTIRTRYGAVVVDGVHDGAVTIGGVEPLLKPDDVIGVFQPSGSWPEPSRPSGRRSGRPKKDNGRYVEIGLRLLEDGFSELRVQQALKQRLVDDGAAPTKEAAYKRARYKIMPEVMREAGNK